MSKQSQSVTIDGNEACARVAHKINEVIAIYPITPASPMGEWADAWSAAAQPNLWGVVPRVIEMQSEGGAAGAVHGALQGGALTTTFTASQGLLLMIPNMYKIAGELTPTVIHVAARSIATHALSIFCDHSDVMAVRSTGFAMLVSNSVQEAMDFSLISQAASLSSSIPFVHFFDGFRTSHEVAKIENVSEDIMTAMLDEETINQTRHRALNPERPVLRGTAQNPDVFFQGREACNPFYEALPDILEQKFQKFAKLTGRVYKLYDYVGPEDAEQLIIIMGSGAEAVEETVVHLNQHGEKVALLKVRLFRPFCGEQLVAAIPASVKSIAVLDRTKEPGAEGEPLYKDVVTALVEYFPTVHSEGRFPEGSLPKVVGGRYGLSSKEFTPGMVKGIYDMLQSSHPKNHFTIGIIDDLSHSHLPWSDDFRTDANKETFEALFYGLGSDGTVGANKNSIKIIGENTQLHAQGYFVYDSKKSGAVTISHLRFGPNPIRSTYLIAKNDAHYVACHQQIFLQRYDMLDNAADNAVFLVNTDAGPNGAWNLLPRKMQEQVLAKNIKFYAIDAYRIARENNMGKRINTIMQTCFFAISDVLPQQEAIAAIKNAVKETYGKKGRSIVQQNYKAIENTLAGLYQVEIPKQASSRLIPMTPINDDAPEFVKQVTMEMIAGRGDAIPVSLMPADGGFPLGTAAYEKRNLADEIPVLETDLCTHCGKCVFVCPHSAIRSKAFPVESTQNAPESFKHIQIKGKDYPDGLHITYQVAPEDCTGCTLCVDICPIHDKAQHNRKALNMAPQPPLREQEKANWDFFLTLPDYDRRDAKSKTMKGAMLLDPFFEFSGACSGCGETPYIRLATQLFGDRMVVANATGCSSIYGANLPTTPWRTDTNGRGPAWNNSLFEDNAEFGLGIRLAIVQHRKAAEGYLKKLAPQLGEAMVSALLEADQQNEAGIYAQRKRVDELKAKLGSIVSADSAISSTDSTVAETIRLLIRDADYLCKKSVWIIGGDGWAYDIGFGGLDHVLTSGENLNILVLDTEVYSNTGGQTSKATPRGAVAKFSAAGKPVAKKDLARLAMDYENVYVAHVAYGASDVQTLHTFQEADSYPGVSLIIAYSPCIAHGIDLKNNHTHQKNAVDAGHWPLFRFDPRKAEKGKNPLKLDSKQPKLPYRDFIKTEARFSMLWRSHPQEAEALLEAAQHEVTERYHRYKQLAALDWGNETPEWEQEEGDN